MASFNEYFVRSSSGSDVAGAGTSHATAYKTIQFAIDDIATTHGKLKDGNADRVNLCSESPFVLSGPLSSATYGNASISAWLVFRGYDASPGDGGKFDIDLDGGAYSVVTGSHDYWEFCDGKLHNNFGTNPLWKMDGVGQRALRLELYDNYYRAIAVGGSASTAEDCYFHDCAGVGAYKIATLGCYFRNGGTKFTRAIEASTFPVAYNIISIDGSSYGIYCPYHYEHIFGNSILCDGGTGVGIYVNGYFASIINNLVEGFSGVGGVGIYRNRAATEDWWRSNAVYNCDTGYYNGIDHIAGDDNDCETLSESPFAKSGADSFENRFTYFAPRNVGNVLNGFPLGSGRAKGAVQAAQPKVTCVLEDAPVWE